MLCDIMKEVLNFLNNLLKENDTIVIATSGGPDSMCLLSILNSLKDKYKLKLICAHVNHGLRSESEKEKNFVENYCVINNIIFEYMKIDKYTNNKFSESEGRKKRYNFFNELMTKYQAKYLMTAHHGDDLIETIMMRIVRGSNLKGYAGILQINNNIVRPLLYVSKKDILDYLREHNIEYVVDKSNDDEKYTRNRYRKQLLPFLKKEDINVHLKFLKYSQELQEYNDYINKIVLDKLNRIYKNNKINIKELLKEDKFIVKKIIEYVIIEIQREDIFNISDSQLDEILKLLKNKSNKQIDLANNYIARISYDNLIIEKKKELNNYYYEFKDKVIIDNNKIERIEKSDKKSNFILRINSSDVKLPLIVRTIKEGDKIKIKNLNGSKKVSDIFIDNKIDINKRMVYPIVTDSNNEIIWIPGLKKSIFDKEINEKYDIIIKYTEGKDE